MDFSKSRAIYRGEYTLLYASPTLKMQTCFNFKKWLWKGPEQNSGFTGQMSQIILVHWNVPQVFCDFTLRVYKRTQLSCKK
jgi:hypothetical protein